MALEIYIRGAINSYQELIAQIPAGQIGVDELLFPIPDENLGSDVRLDKKIQNPFAVAYRDKDNQSQVFKYKSGTGEIFEVPRASQKTPIGEDLKDSLVFGIEGNARYADNARKLMLDVVADHLSNHNVTKWKQALDVIRTGIFEANGLDGKNIGLKLDFERKAALGALTYDFTAGGATFDEALQQFHDALDAEGAPKEGRVLFCGQSWLNNFSQDAKVREFLDSNSANVLLQQSMNVDRFRNTAHLFLAAMYRNPQSVSPTAILSFNPDTPYYPYEGAAAEPFIPDDEAMMCVIGARRWRVLRGIDAFNDRGKVERKSGDVVVDAYPEPDPICDYIRSATRHVFLPGNINHTARTTGTF
jgi:hypothetical protein